MKLKYILILLIEILYIIFRNYLFFNIQNNICKEILLTIIRILVVLVYFILFKKQIRIELIEYRYLRKPSIFIALMLFMTIPIIIGTFVNSFSLYIFVMILTSFFVGLREEVLYRGILQYALSRNIGIIFSILISNVIFVFAHVGFQVMILENIINLILCGIFLGVLFFLTRNLLLCIILHSVFDATYVLFPLAKETSQWTGNGIILLSVLLLFVEGIRKRNNYIGLWRLFIGQK